MSAGLLPFSCCGLACTRPCHARPCPPDLPANLCGSHIHAHSGTHPPTTAARSVCRLQPALSPDGSAAVFDSSHNGLGWQIYEAALPEPGAADSSSTALASDSAALGSDLREIRMAAARQQQGVLRGGAYQPRQLYIDLGSQEGSSVLQFLQRRGWQGQFEVRRAKGLAGWAGVVAVALRASQPASSLQLLFVWALTQLPA